MRIISLLLLIFAFDLDTSSQTTINSDSLLNAWQRLDEHQLIDSINVILNQMEENHVQGADTLYALKHQFLLKEGDQTKEISNAVSFTFYLVKSFQPERAKKFIEPYFTQLTAIENPLQQADILYAYGHAHEDLRENERAFELMNQAITIYDEARDSSYDNYTQALLALNRVSFTIAEYATSSTALNKAKALALRNRDSTALLGIHQDLTILFSQVGLYDEAENYWNERSRYFSSPESKESKAIGLINLGRNLILQDRWEEALQNYRQSKSFSPYTGGWSFMDLYNYNGIIECLYFLNRRDSIPYYFRLMQEDFEKINRSVTYEFLLKQSEFLTQVATRRFGSAEKIGLALLSNAEKSNDGAEIMMHARFLSELYQASGEAGKALQFNKKYVRLKDSIQTAHRTNALLLYQTQFETAEKENEIFRLEKEGELLNAKIERNRLLRALLIAGLALIILTAILIYYRIKQKQLLRMQHLRTSISSDLHDEVGSLLSGVTMQTQMLEVIPDEKRSDFIKEIGENTKRAVTTMRDLVWSIDSRRDKIEDLKDKISDTCHQLLEPAGFQYSIDLDDQSDRIKKINPKSKKEIYLIAKEAIHNIARHSTGDQVNIRLIENKNDLQLTIEDNGTKSTKNKSTAGQGLDNMQYRAKEINGSVEILRKKDSYVVKIVAPI